MVGGCAGTHKRCDPVFTSELRHRIERRAFGDLEVAYEWAGGLGPGTVSAVIRGSGTSQLTLHKYGGKPDHQEAIVPPDELMGILNTIQDGDFSCIRVVPREVCLTDIGRTTITVRFGDASHEVFWDETHRVEPTRGLGELLSRLFGLSDIFGVSFNWGAFASTPMPCELFSMDKI